MRMGSEAETNRFTTTDETGQTIEGRHVCPFCGAVRDQADGVCMRCTMESSPATRQATKSRIGPWYVLQTRNPAAPGMKYETLLTFVRKGRVKAQSIVRGPTTHQLWRFASQVKGLSREFYLCYSCGRAIAREATVCLHCNRLQDLPANPDVFLESLDAPSPQAPVSAPIFRDLGVAPAINIKEEGPAVPMPPGTLSYELNGSKSEPVASTAPAAPEPPKIADRLKKGADGFLTAEDLATAFQLDFSPKERRNKKTLVAPIATRDPHGFPPRRRRRWGAILFLLFLIAGIGASAFFYQRNPVFRARFNHGFDVASAWTREKWATLQKLATRPQHAPTDGATLSHGPVSSGSDKNVSPPAPQPSSSGNPWDQLYHQQATDSSPSTDKTANAPAAPTKSPQREGTIDDVRALYGSALDAEGQHDYATAIKKYEEIKEFPTDLWPGDLDLRLKEARALAH